MLTPLVCKANPTTHPTPGAPGLPCKVRYSPGSQLFWTRAAAQGLAACVFMQLGKRQGREKERRWPSRQAAAQGVQPVPLLHLQAALGLSGKRIRIEKLQAPKGDVNVLLWADLQKYLLILLSYFST